MNPHFILKPSLHYTLLRLTSADNSNRLACACVQALSEQVAQLRADTRNIRPLILTGTQRFFSAGADLREINLLTGAEAYEFARMGQSLMQRIAEFPAPVYAAIEGYCMGGGLDLALACHHRIAAPNAVFGHRGAALGIMTGWGGTQRLPRLIGKAHALKIFVTAETVSAAEALRIGLIEAIADDPVAEAARRIGFS